MQNELRHYDSSRRFRQLRGASVDPELGPSVRLHRRILSRAANAVVGPLVRKSTLGAFQNTVSQIQLKLNYREILEANRTLPPLSEVGFSVFSGDDTDGILLFVFSVIGSGRKRSVELCAGDGIQCNTANLIINHGWTGLLIDGDLEQVRRGQRYYRMSPCYPPRLVHAWVTRENVNRIIKENGFEGEIDLLVLDMDGVDYWIWDAIEVVAPRVVVAEYQDIIGPERAITVPYAEDFNAYEYPTTQGLPNYCGASLAALVKLAANKGYRLVGRSRSGVDAIFIRQGLAVGEIPEVSVAECLDHPKSIWGNRERFPLVCDLPWVEV